MKKPPHPFQRDASMYLKLASYVGGVSVGADLERLNRIEALEKTAKPLIAGVSSSPADTNNESHACLPESNPAKPETKPSES